jgi:hypothetical protein
MLPPFETTIKLDGVSGFQIGDRVSPLVDASSPPVFGRRKAVGKRSSAGLRHLAAVCGVVVWKIAAKAVGTARVLDRTNLGVDESRFEK